MIIYVRIFRFDYPRQKTESKNDLAKYEFPFPTVQKRSKE